MRVTTVSCKSQVGELPDRREAPTLPFMEMNTLRVLVMY
jgi:hypothetical protein